jgi:hypothetical protein
VGIFDGSLGNGKACGVEFTYKHYLNIASLNLFPLINEAQA